MHIQWNEFTLPIEKITVSWMKATLSKRGLISINRAAFRAMAQPSHVVLLYDTVNFLIGLRPAGSHIKNAMRVRRRRDAQSTYQISAKNFCNYYGIALPCSLQFNNLKPTEDGTLILDLRTATEIVRAPRAKKFY